MLPAKENRRKISLRKCFVLSLFMFSIVSILHVFSSLQDTFQNDVSIVSSIETSYASTVIWRDPTPREIEERYERQKMIRDKLPNENRPSIAWLMSFPNSGTSYTMKLVNTDSNMTVATNYPLEAHFGIRYTLYDQSSSELPPYILHSNLTLPKRYIMTKTHCTGYCTLCPPVKYTNITIQEFLDDCRSSRDTNFGVYDSYASGRVEKAIHLMRHPIDNIVSNYNLQRKKFLRNNSTTLLEVFTNDQQGFLKMCEASDNQWRKQEKEIFKNNYKAVRKVRCHALIHRWILWHNRAFEVLHTILKIPTLNIWYEDYGINAKKEREKLFKFLDLDAVFDYAAFESGKTYLHYFTPEERNQIMAFIKTYARPEVWEMVQRYAEHEATP